MDNRVRSPPWLLARQTTNPVALVVSPQDNSTPDSFPEADTTGVPTGLFVVQLALSVTSPAVERKSRK